MAWTEKNIEYIFILRPKSFETAHGKLKLAKGRKKKCFVPYPQVDEYPQILNFFETKLSFISLPFCPLVLVNFKLLT